MQLLETDDVHGLRAAIITFASDASSLRFVLVPVCPLGEPAHYDDLRETLRSCDLVVTTPPGARQRGMTARPRVEAAVGADRPRPAREAGRIT
jgi:hypothetical protein